MTIANTSQNCKVIDKAYLQLHCKLPGNEKPEIANRRFVYIWENKNKEYINHGLFMTDDNGLVFNFWKVISKWNSCGVKDYFEKKCLEVEKFNYKTKKFEKKKACLFAGIEDVIAFQKSLGDLVIYADEQAKETRLSTAWQIPDYPEDLQTKELPAEARGFKYVQTSQEKGYNYLIPYFAPQEYLFSIAPQSEYFIIFCPPEIVNRIHQETNEDLTKVEELKEQHFKFWKKPCDLMTNNAFYIGKEGKSSDDLRELLHLKPTVPIYSLDKKFNKSENPIENASADSLISVPDNGETPMGSGTILDTTVNLDTVDPSTLKYNILNKEFFKDPSESEKKENERCYFKPDSIIIKTTLPVNFEEYLSRLVTHTLFLDCECQKMIEYSTRVSNLSSQFREIYDLLELMVTWPGYKKVNITRTHFIEKIKFSEKEKEDFIKKITPISEISDNLFDLAYSEKNIGYAREKYDVLEDAKVIFSILESPDFLLKMDQFFLYMKNTEKPSEDSPYSIRDWGNKTDDDYYPFIIQKILHDVCIIMTNIDLPAPNQEKYTVLINGLKNLGDTEETISIGKAFYFSHILHLESKLQRDNLTENDIVELNKAISEYRIEFPTKNVHDEYLPLVNSYQEQPLAKIFSDLKKEIPNIWNNTIGPDSYLTAIMKVGSRFRARFCLLACAKDKRMAYYTLKQELVMGRFKSVITHPNERIKEICRIIDRIETDGARKALFHKTELRGGKLQHITLESQPIPEKIKLYEEELKEINKRKNKLTKDLQAALGDDYAKAPALATNIATALTICFAIKDVHEFYKKCVDPKYDLTAKDIKDFAQTLHSTGAAVLTGFDFPLLKSHKIFIEINNKIDSIIPKKLKSYGYDILKLKRFGNKLFYGGQAAFFWYDAIVYSLDALEAHFTGEHFTRDMRCAQALLSAYGGYTYLGAFLGGVAPNPIAGAVVILLILSCEVAINVRIALEKGIETYIQTIREIITKSKFYKEFELPWFNEECISKEGNIKDIKALMYYKIVSLLDSGYKLYSNENEKKEWKEKISKVMKITGTPGLLGMATLGSMATELFTKEEDKKQVSYNNLDLIKAGSVLKMRGYSWETILKICNNLGGEHELSKQVVDGFSELETFTYGKDMTTQKYINMEEGTFIGPDKIPPYYEFDNSQNGDNFPMNFNVDDYFNQF